MVADTILSLFTYCFEVAYYVAFSSKHYLNDGSANEPGTSSDGSRRYFGGVNLVTLERLLCRFCRKMLSQ